MPDVPPPSQPQNDCMTTIFGPSKAPAPGAELTIRRARPGDLPALAGLAQMEATRMPTGQVLVAQVGDELWAAISVDDFHSVADPFRPSGELVFLLVERARQLRRSRTRR